MDLISYIGIKSKRVIRTDQNRTEQNRTEQIGMDYLYSIWLNGWKSHMGMSKGKGIAWCVMGWWLEITYEVDNGRCT